MRNGLFCLMIMIFSVPLLAQNTPNELNQKQFQELMEQFFGQNNAFFDQLTDSTFTQMPNGGIYKFYNFSDADSLMQHFPMEEMQKMMVKSFGMIDPNSITESFGAMEKLDLSDFMKMNPDSLKQQLKQFEQFFGDEFQQLIPKDFGKESKEGKKKRKTYSL